MDWRAEAVDKLKIYRLKKASVTGLEEEIQGLESELADLRSASKPPEGEIFNNMAQQDALMRSLALTRQWLKRVNQGLATLREDDRRLLQCFFMQKEKGGLDQLRQELGVEDAELYKRRDQALRYFTLALYGITEL